MTTKKTTKREMFNAILGDLTDPKHIECIKHELELLDRKKSATGGETKTAQANKVIADELYTYMKENTFYRASEFINRVNGIDNTSKATSILGVLCHADKVKRVTEKGKVYFVKRV